MAAASEGLLTAPGALLHIAAGVVALAVDDVAVMARLLQALGAVLEDALHWRTHWLRGEQGVAHLVAVGDWRSDLPRLVWMTVLQARA